MTFRQLRAWLKCSGSVLREKKTEGPTSTVVAALREILDSLDEWTNHCTPAVSFGVLETKSNCGNSVNSSFG